MPFWTKEQSDAINLDNSNIIVSAGAGSGKTAVLTARVIRKIKDGVHINNLLILTFTNASAFEMLDRIRKALREENFEEELNRIDSSYITTFDSYALSIVKKYHYLLNVSKNVKIVDTTIIDIEKNRIINEIFDDYYEKNDSKFNNLIANFFIKDDSELKKFILHLNNKLDMKYDKKLYLKNYINNYASKDFFYKVIKEYEEYVFSIKNKIITNLDNISNYVDTDYYHKLESSLKSIIESDDYNGLKKSLDKIKIPNLPKNSCEYTKLYKEKIKEITDELKVLTVYNNIDDIYYSLNSTVEYMELIIDIVTRLDEEIYNFKFLKDVYEFNDISKMAITIIKNHKEIRDEIKYSFNEIMIDEYQDTNDLQEEFVSNIENNNVYMVGDIKQSIYKFRNANPYIFKNKYDNYANNINGKKIDLVKNFRSRSEVLDDINYIFNKIMDNDIGGANYIKEHQMVFGNNVYTENITDSNYNMEIYNYKLEDNKYSKDEVEAFIVANDIKEKLNNNYQVYDKDLKKLRRATYSDFVILIAKSKAFDLYKKIFEYLNIPMTVLKDKKINMENDIFVMNNIFKLLVNIKNKEYKEEFYYNLCSISRSYLFALDDEVIFDIVTNKDFKNSVVYNKALSIMEYFDNNSIREIIDKVIDVFNIYDRLITVGDVEEAFKRLDYIKNIADSMEDLEYTFTTFSKCFDDIIKNYELKYKEGVKDVDSVKIMTIHTSKGLEFPICYFPSLYNKFNDKEIKSRFSYDDKYGIVTPCFDEEISNTVVKTLLKNKYFEEDISEKLRLFYVSLTRAKEKMIFIGSLEDNNRIYEIVPKEEKMKYRSFLDVLNSISSSLKEYVTEININNINLTKDYNFIKDFNYKDFIQESKEKIEYKKYISNVEEVKEDKYSKTVNKLIDSDIKTNMEFGTKMHYLLEVIDFKNPELNKYNLDEFTKKKIEKLLKSKLFSNINLGKVYKEYEFIEHTNNSIKRGVIDLMVEYDKHIDIIDYKLKDIDDENYIKQLNGYKEYIYNKTKKNVNLYLYSIMDEKIKKIN